MNWQEFRAKYQPISDEYTVTADEQDAKLVWTVVEEDGKQFLRNGYRHVNNIGYCLTAVPWEEDQELIVEVESEETGPGSHVYTRKVTFNRVAMLEIEVRSNRPLSDEEIKQHIHDRHFEGDYDDEINLTADNDFEITDIFEDSDE